MIKNYLFEQNLQWQEKKFQSGTERILLADIKKLLDIDHILAISGIRRCGKSFLLKQLINHLVEKKIPVENILFVNLELPAFSGQPAAEILDDIWETYQKLKSPKNRLYIFLDEIQTLPEWEKWVRYKYDSFKGRIKFIITGSNSRLLSSEFATLLSGRVIEKRLYPFSFQERLRHINIQYNDPQMRVLNLNQIMTIFDDLLKNGGMPELFDISSTEIKREIISSYFDTIIYKDIVPRFSIRQSELLKNLAVYLTNQTTSILNTQKLVGVFDSNRNSLKEFTSYLELSLLLSLLEKFDYSAKKRALAAKKVYVADNAFYSFIPIRFSPDHGKLLENLVAVELQKTNKQFFYWRNHVECDFIVMENQKPVHAIQVCYHIDENNQKRELTGLKTACNILNISGSILTYNQSDEIKIENTIYKVQPVYQWLLSLK